MLGNQLHHFIFTAIFGLLCCFIGWHFGEKVGLSKDNMLDDLYAGDLFVKDDQNPSVSEVLYELEKSGIYKLDNERVQELFKDIAYQPFSNSREFWVAFWKWKRLKNVNSDNALLMFLDDLNTDVEAVEGKPVINLQ